MGNRRREYIDNASSFASFKNHSHHGSKSPPFAKRKGDAASEARRRGIPYHPISEETPNNNAPIIRIIQQSFASWFKISPLRAAQGGAMRSETQGDALPPHQRRNAKQQRTHHSHHSKIIPIMVQKQEWIPASAGMT